MRSEKVRKTVAAVLAGVMCFGLVAVRQNVIAKQNICSNDNAKKEDADNDDMRKELLESEYLYFGSYPQMEMDEKDLTKEITEAEYVSGEAVVLGSKYLRVKEEEKYHYYKYEPIRWKVDVIRDGKAFLQSDKILDVQSYTDNWDSRSWNDTNICKWLNSNGTGEKGFYHTAFGTWEQDILVSSPISDYIGFLVDASLFEGIQVKICLPWSWWGGKKETTDYTKYRERNQGDINCDGDWWLLDDTLKRGIKYVDSNGVEHNKRFGMVLDSSDESKLYYCAVPSNVKGVCPAIILDVTNEKLWYTDKEQQQFGNETKEEVLYKLETMHNQAKYPESYGGFETEEENEKANIMVKMTDISAKGQAEFLQKAGIEKQIGKKYEISFAECQYSLKEKEQIRPGDVDNNKKIDLLDAKKALKWALNLEQPDELYEKGDVDGDKVVTLADAKKILRMALNLE